MDNNAEGRIQIISGRKEDISKDFGIITRELGNQRTRFKEEIHELVPEPNTNRECGIIVGDRAPKRAHLGQLTGHRPMSYPRYRWDDGVAEDLRNLTVIIGTRPKQNGVLWC